MKLTIDKVRALRDMAAADLSECDVPICGREEPCLSCEFNRTAEALAEEWIAVRTVRWESAHSDTVGAGVEVRLLPPTGEAVASYWHYTSAGDDYSASAGPGSEHGDGTRSPRLMTLAEARAWCEEQARASGYEVAT